MANNISQHPEWEFCGRCKYFVSYSPSLDFEKDFDKTFYGRCEHPKGDERIVAAVADCSMFERRKGLTQERRNRHEYEKFL